MTALPRLYAKGLSKVDGETPMTFWSAPNMGGYRYEIFAGRGTAMTSEVLEASYEDAMEKFEDKIDMKTGVLM